MHLHFLLTANANVIANMSKLLQQGDSVILLDEASTVNLRNSDRFTLYQREEQASGNNAHGVHIINDQQWLALCNKAQLIYSWY